MFTNTLSHTISLFPHKTTTHISTILHDGDFQRMRLKSQNRDNFVQKRNKIQHLDVIHAEMLNFVFDVGQDGNAKCQPVLKLTLRFCATNEVTAAACK